MAELPHPQAPARFRAMFPDLADWLQAPWTGPPPFLAGQVFRLEEAIRDNRYVIRAELPGLDPDERRRGHRRRPDPDHPRRAPPAGQRAAPFGVPLRIARPPGQAPRPG